MDDEEESNEVRQKNEIEVLESIFMEDFIDLRLSDPWKVSRPPEIKINLLPQQSMHSDQDVNAKASLYVKCDQDYPNSIPLMEIQDEKGLSKQMIKDLERELKDLADSFLGEVMILEIAQHVQKFLHTHNTPKFKSFYEEMLSNKKKQEQQIEMEEVMKKNELQREQEKQSLVIQEEINRKQEALRMEYRRRRSLSINKQEDEEVKQESNESPTHNALGKKTLESNITVLECKNHQGSQLLKFDGKPSKSIRRSHCIGHGEYGETIYAGIDLTTGNIVLITEWQFVLNSNLKKISLDDENYKNCLKQLSVIEHEMNNSIKLEHAGLLRYIAMKYGLEKNRMVVNVVSEYPHGGSLSFYITNKLPIEIPIIQNIVQKILPILDYLHDNSVIHRNLSDACIYLEDSGSLKLSNYGIHLRLAELISSFNKKPLDQRYPLSLGRGGKKSDIYRLGLILISLAIGNIVDSMIPKIPENLPSNFSDFLSKCLIKDERERWSVKQLLNHNFINQSLMYPDEDEIKKENIDEDNLISDPVMIPGMASDNVNQSRIKEEFQVLKWLGKGGFGDVLKVRNKLDGRSYALKRILLNPSNKLLNRKITREVKLLSRLNHENVVRYYNSWIETSVENVTDETNLSSVNTNGSTTPTTASTNANSISENPVGNRSLVSFNINDDIEEMAPPEMDASIEWTMSSHHPRMLEDESSSDEEEDVFGISCLLRSEISESIAFEDTKDGNTKSKAFDIDEETNVDNSPTPKKKKVVQCMYIQMEFCENSTLRSAINDGLYEQKDRKWRLFREIIEGLVHIHQQGMIHRDLKPVNIFLDSCDHVKIGDFGLATTDIKVKSNLFESTNVGANIDLGDVSISDQLNTADGTMTGRVGTALYVAPELATSGTKPTYNQKVDIYSLGIMFFEMCYPLLSTGMERVKVLVNMRTKEIRFPSDFEQHLTKVEIELLKWVLNHDQNSRPSSQELLSSDLLPPAEIQQTLLNEHFKKTIANPQSKAYKYLISNLFKQKTSIAADFTYDMDASSKQSLSINSALLYKDIKERISKVFHKHGASPLSNPLLMPHTENYLSNQWSVNLMDHGGGIISLPHDLRLGFARAVARREITNIRRYTIDKVYQEQRFFGGHPRELVEASFDIISSSVANLMPDAEVLLVVSDVVNEFSQLKRRNYCLRLNHAKIVKAILLHCGIGDEKHNDVFEMIKSVKTKNGISKTEFQTKLLNIGAADNRIAILLELIDVEDSFHKVSNALKVIVKRRGMVGSLMKQGLHELECVLNHVESLDFNHPVLINPLLVYNIQQFSGMFFQFFCELKRKKKKPIMDVLAAGGCYDQLISSFRLSVNIPNMPLKEHCQHAVGVSIAVDKIFNAVNEENVVMDNLFDVVVCSIGRKPCYKEKCIVLKELWNSGINSVVYYDDAQDLNDIHELCIQQKIKFMVILKDSESSLVELWVLEKDKFTDKKLNTSELADYILNYSSMKSEGGDGNNSKQEVGKMSSNELSQFNTNNLIISFIVTEKQKMNPVIKRRFETQISTKLSSLLPSINQKIIIETIATDLSISILKTLVVFLDIDGSEQSFNESIAGIINRYPKYKKYLTKLCDEISYMKFEKRSSIIILFSLPDNVYKVIM